MSVQRQFEAMITDYLPHTDLSKDPDYPGFYRDPCVQTAWAGFQALHPEQAHDTTNSAGDNRAKDHTGDSE